MDRREQVTRARETVMGLNAVEKAAAEGLASVAEATDKVHAATQDLAQTMDNVDSAVMLVESTVDSVATAVKDMNRNVTDALVELTSAVRTMDRSTTRLQVAALALALTALVVTVLSLL